MNEIASLSVLDLKNMLARREISSREICEAYLDRINALDGDIGAYITVTRGRALRAADEFDSGTRGNASLGGIPYAAKDNLCTAGVTTTCASNMLRDFIPPYSATVIEKLGASPLLGKTNMDEFGMGSTCESSAFKITKNPRDTSRTPGGSSGGSAAAVAAGMAPFALGSDTGGSVRLPAAFCGVVGLCPTYGAVSRYGLIEFTSSLDRVGVIARSVADCAHIFSEISGYDKRDRTNVRHESGVHATDTAHLRIGVLPDEYIDKCSPEVRATYEKTLASLATNGCDIVQLTFPSLEQALSAYYVISSSEASSNLARYDGIRYGRAYTGDALDLRDYYIKTRSAGFGSEVKRRIILGTYALSAEGERFYERACHARELIKREALCATNSCDIILTPTATAVAPKLGMLRDGDMYAGDIFTVPSSLAGLPAISVPAGDGLPVGIQLISAPHREDILFTVGALIEGGAK